MVFATRAFGSAPPGPPLSARRSICDSLCGRRHLLRFEGQRRAPVPVRASIEPGWNNPQYGIVGSTSCGAAKGRTRLRRAVRTTNFTEYSALLQWKQDSAGPALRVRNGLLHRHVRRDRKLPKETCGVATKHRRDSTVHGDYNLVACKRTNAAVKDHRRPCELGRESWRAAVFTWSAPSLSCSRSFCATVRSHRTQILTSSLQKQIA